MYLYAYKIYTMLIILAYFLGRLVIKTLFKDNVVIYYY